MIVRLPHWVAGFFTGVCAFMSITSVADAQVPSGSRVGKDDCYFDICTLRGKWTGLLTENLRGKMKRIYFIIDFQDQDFAYVSAPDFPCSGTLKRIPRDTQFEPQEHVFEETIRDGAKCVGKGIVVIKPLEGARMEYVWKPW